MTETTVTQRDPRLARFDTFAEVQNEIAARITIALVVFLPPFNSCPST